MNRSRVSKKYTVRKKRRRMKHMMYGGLLAMVLIMVGIIYSSVITNHNTEDLPQNETLPEQSVNSQQEVPPITTPYFIQEAGVIESILTETNNIVYSLHYPRLSQAEIDSDIYLIVKDMISNAENSQTQVEHLEDRGMLYMNYDSYLVGQNLVSIIFYVEYRSTSTDVPEIYKISRRYTLSDGVRLTNDELFKDGYLGAIEEYCRNSSTEVEDWKQYIQTEEWNSLCKELKENRRNLSLTQEGIQIEFTVAQTEIIPQEHTITIPYEAMRKYLKFEYQTGVTEEEETDIETEAESEKPAVDNEKPMIALTFDDGPYPKVTNRILDALKAYDSRATFYVVGNRLRNYPETLKRIIAENNEIGNHTYNHKSLTLLQPKVIQKELAGVDDYLLELLDMETITLRPPYGAISDVVRKAVKMPMIYWSVDTEDWKNRNTKAIVKKVMNQVKDGDIILFHDLYETTASAIELLVPQLIEEGYQLVTVSELFEAKGITLKNGKVYYNAR